MLRNSNNKGFTIIEVVITIAIGAAVMALVLNAVQGARRSQRNTNRQADISSIVGAANQYNAAHNTLPDAVGEITVYIDATAHYDLANDLEWETSFTTRTTKLNATAATDAASKVAKDTNADTIAIINKTKCKLAVSAEGGDFDDFLEAGSARQAVIISRVEGDPNVFCKGI